MWYTASTGTTGAAVSTLNVPVGIFGVQSVSTMLNTIGGFTTGGTAICANGAPVGTAGCTADAAAYATITFEFDATDPTGKTGTLSYERWH